MHRKVKLKVNFIDQEVEVPFYVLKGKMSESLIPGFEFLVQQNVSINFGSKMVMMIDQSVFCAACRAGCNHNKEGKGNMRSLQFNEVGNEGSAPRMYTQGVSIQYTSHVVIEPGESQHLILPQDVQVPYGHVFMFQ